MVMALLFAVHVGVTGPCSWSMGEGGNRITYLRLGYKYHTFAWNPRKQRENMVFLVVEKARMHIRKSLFLFLIPPGMTLLNI